HEIRVIAEGWRDWAGSEECLRGLRRRLANLGLAAVSVTRMIGLALEDQGWRSLAALDAATRTVHAVVRSGGLHRGAESGRVLERLFMKVRDTNEGQRCIPAAYWSAQAVPRNPDLSQSASEEASGRGGEELIVRGAVLVRVRGRRPASLRRTE